MDWPSLYGILPACSACTTVGLGTCHRGTKENQQDYNTFGAEDHVPRLPRRVVAGDLGVEEALADVRFLGLVQVGDDALLLLLGLLGLGGRLDGGVRSRRLRPDGGPRGPRAVREEVRGGTWGRRRRLDDRRGGRGGREGDGRGHDCSGHGGQQLHSDVRFWGAKSGGGRTRRRGRGGEGRGMKAAWPEMMDARRQGRAGPGKDELKAGEKGDEKQVVVVFCENVVWSFLCSMIRATGPTCSIFLFCCRLVFRNVTDLMYT